MHSLALHTCSMGKGICSSFYVWVYIKTYVSRCIFLLPCHKRPFPTLAFAATCQWEIEQWGSDLFLDNGMWHIWFAPKWCYCPWPILACNVACHKRRFGFVNRQEGIQWARVSKLCIWITNYYHWYLANDMLHSWCRTKWYKFCQRQTRWKHLI